MSDTEIEPKKGEEAIPNDDAKKLASRWLASIKQAQKIYDPWYKKVERIGKRYRSEREVNDTSMASTKFNLFWSNVQTLGPATYSRRPKAEVSRRFRDQDPVARLGGELLQRTLQYEIDTGNEFHQTMQSAVLDRLLGGQAVAWVRYEPTFKTEVQQVPDPEVGPIALKDEEIEVIDTEFAPVDYVYYKDVLISPARVWADVRWVARRLMFSKDRLKARFGDTYAKYGGNVDDVPCNYDPNQADPDRRDSGGRQLAVEDNDPTLLRALIWELWDKESKQAIWVCQGCDCPLDVVDDPAGLEDFFPMPRPLWATMTNDTLLPVPDFVIYRDQLRELDDISNRISLLTKALRMVGVYDASQSALQSMLQSGRDNTMIPVNQWGAFAEKGGLKGVTDFMPVDQVITVLKGLYESRETLKQTVYEITGMADIIRGASMPSETLGAQQIKAKFANLRLSSRQQEVAVFVTAILQIKAQLICNHYSAETIIAVSAAEQMLEVQQHPERLQQAIQLLKAQKVRQYRIEVNSDSMVELDQVGEQERRDKFMSTISNFFLAMKNIAESSPHMMPVAMEMLKFAVRGFSVGRDLESTIEDAIEKIKADAAKPKPPPPPSPDEVKMMIAKGSDQTKLQLQSMKDDTTKNVAELKASVELTLADLQASIQEMMQYREALNGKMASQQEHVQGLESQMHLAAQRPEPQPAPPPDLAGALTPLVQQIAQSQQESTQQIAALMELVSKPRIRTPVKGPDGGIAHVRDELEKS